MASRDLLFVIGDAASITFPDQQMQDFFELWDWIVTLISDEDSDIDSDSFLEGFDLVVYSETCSSTTLGSSGDTAAVGIMSLEPGQWDDIRLISGTAASFAPDSVAMIVSHESSGGIAGSGEDNHLNIASETKSMRFSANAAVGGAGGTATGRLGAPASVRHVFAFWETGEDLDTGKLPHPEATSAPTEFRHRHPTNPYHLGS